MAQRMSSQLHRFLNVVLAVTLFAVSVVVAYAQTAGTVNYEYDELNRLRRIEHLDGTVVDYLYDATGNRTEVVHYLDATPPTGTITINSGATATNASAVTLSLTCSDNTGCFQMQFSNDGSAYSAPQYYATTKAWALTEGEGTRTVYVKFRDRAGNWSSAYSNSILVETTPPVTTFSPAGGTYNTQQSITLTCNDGTGSGCAATHYTTDSSTPTTSSSVYASPIAVSTPTTLRFFSRDVAGNNETAQSITYTVDSQPPVTTAAPAGGTYSGSISVTLTCSETGGTGCANTYYTTDGSIPTTSSTVYSSPITISSDTTLRFFSRDVVGNSETPQSQTYTILSGIDTYTKLMLHMDGTNGSTTFTDSSSSPKTVTPSGNAQITTAQSKFGGASGVFDGNGDYVSIPDSDDWNFGSGDFTMDFWVRFNSLPSSGTAQEIVSQSLPNGTTYWQFVLYNDSGTYKWFFQACLSSSVVIDFRLPTSISAADWHHIALVRNGTSFYVFQDGVQVGATQTDPDAVPDVSNVLGVGGMVVTTPHSFLNGRLDELRISKGIARWTSSFSPPSGPYTNN